MEMKHFITALENISCLIAQVIGAMEGEMAKKIPVRVMIHPNRN